MNIPIGIANSVSANFGYDPLDSLHFAQQSNFDLLQIFLSENLINNAAELGRIFLEIEKSSACPILLRVDGFLNRDWFESDYSAKLFAVFAEQNISRFIIYYDEKATLDEMLKIVADLVSNNLTVYLENFFQFDGVQKAEKNLKKYMALFTLANSHGHNLSVLPVLDIPSFFYRNLQFNPDLSLRWCFQLFNYFDNKKIPMILHLIDAKDAGQNHNSYCAIGEGYIPYRQIFNFINKNHFQISSIILEFEDKINALKSRENLSEILG